jgi:hypothetical protein
MADALFGAPAEGDPFAFTPSEGNPNVINDEDTVAATGVSCDVPVSSIDQLKGPPVPKSFSTSLSEAQTVQTKTELIAGDQQQQGEASAPSQTFPPPPISAPFPPPSPSQARLPEGAVKTLAVTPTRDGESRKEEVEEVELPITEAGETTMPGVEPAVTEVVETTTPEVEPVMTEVVVEAPMMEKEGPVVDEVVAEDEVEKEDEVSRWLVWARSFGARSNSTHSLTNPLFFRRRRLLLLHQLTLSLEVLPFPPPPHFLRHQPPCRPLPLSPLRLPKQ